MTACGAAAGVGLILIVVQILLIGFVAVVAFRK